MCGLSYSCFFRVLFSAKRFSTQDCQGLRRVIVLEFVSVVSCLGLCDGCVCAG